MSIERQRRIEELRPRVAERKAQRDRIFQQQVRASMREEVGAFLLGLNSLQMLGFTPVQEAVGAPYVLQGHIFRYEENPFSRIEAYIMATIITTKSPAEPEKLHAWLNESLKCLGIGEDYFIAFGESFGFIGWAKVHVLNTENWLWDVWSQTKFRDMMVLSSDQSNALFIYNEEYHYEAYLHKFHLSTQPIEI